MDDLHPLEKRIRKAPLPCDGPSPWDGISSSDALSHTAEAISAYTDTAESLAHAYLVLCTEKPNLLDRDDRALWKAFEERWPEGDSWLRGISGFQQAWARGTVATILESK